MIPRFKKIQVDQVDKTAIDRLQGNIDSIFSILPKLEILDGQLLKGIKLTTGSVNLVSHKLGRPLIGYVIVLKSASTDIWDDQLSNTLSDKYLTLNCTSDVTVSMWVF